jgi:hypothetical protein
VREREAARVNLKCSVMIAKSGTLVNPISVRAVVHYDNDNDCLTLQIELPNDHGIALSVGDDDAPAVRFWHGNGKSALDRLSLKALREWLKTALGQVQVRARTAQNQEGCTGMTSHQEMRKQNQEHAPTETQVVQPPSHLPPMGPRR